MFAFMKRRQAFRYVLRPTREQEQAFRQFTGSRRFVYNQALELQNRRRKASQRRLSYAALCRELTAWKSKPEWRWLKEAPSQSLQQGLKDLCQAFDRMDKGLSAPPRFRRRGLRESFRYPQGVRLDPHADRVFLPKIGWVRYRNSRPVTGQIKNTTIKREGERWILSIQTEREVEAPVWTRESLSKVGASDSDFLVGADLGIARFLTLDSGAFIPPRNSYKRSQDKLARAQRSLARKKKGSQNWQKQKRKVARIHRKIAAQRHDFLHKVSTYLSKSHAVVVLEDLKVKNMMASAAGTKEAPGRNVRQKAGLNRAIGDQGWGQLKALLEYKTRWYGLGLILVPPAYTSQRCARCGETCAQNRTRQAAFECVSCGWSLNADHNAALNIRAAGLAVLACGAEALVSAMKQEPSETPLSSRHAS